MKYLLIISALLFSFPSVSFAEPTQIKNDRDFPQYDASLKTSIKPKMLGVGLQHGDAMALANIDPKKKLKSLSEIAPSAFLYINSFDHAAQTFGEFHSFKVPAGVESRGPNAFMTKANALPAVRATDFYTELDAAERVAGGAFGSRSIVLDLFRYKGDWYLRWDGNFESETNKFGKGTYGLYRQDMVDDLLQEIETIAKNQKPEYFIIGDGMERFLGTNGLAPAEFSNFLAFFKDAVGRIKKGNAATKVGCGINYDNFLSNVVPEFYQDQNSTYEVFTDAFEAVALPCAEIGDVFALRSYRAPGNDMLAFQTGDIDVLTAYQFLRAIPELYEIDKKIVWYSVGSPLSGPVNYLAQKNYFDNFLDWTAGTPTSLMVWRRALNIEGSDTSDQSPASRCKAFTESSRGFQAPVSFCYDGFYSSIFSEKEIVKYIHANNK